MIGRPPKPTALKELEGNPGRRPLNASEPKLTVKAPTCPFPKPPAVIVGPGMPKPRPSIIQLARKEWNRNVRVLLQMRVLTEADQTELANMCMHQAILLDAFEQLKTSSSLYRTQSGYVQQNPLLGVINRSSALVSRIASNFGLNPSGRVRLHALPGGQSKTGNKWAKFKTPASDHRESAKPN